MDQRIEDLQVRIAFLEKNIADLDGVVQDLGRNMAGLEEQLQELRQSFTEAAGEAARASLKDDVPPHH
jgi:uncharacterized coiled-coil protein SlyX